MKERPILFRAPMVRALLAGTKTQTRRICKSQPYSNGFAFDGRYIACHEYFLPPSAMLMDVRRGPYSYTTSNLEGWESECPHGFVGDRLWVRETWQSLGIHEGLKPSEIPPGSDVQYPATYDGWVSKHRPSIHMPRWASRITLEITDVRVERLNDISEEDCRAEGYPADRDARSGGSQIDPWLWYRGLWESINGPGSWAENPWVWVIEFRRLP